MFRKRVPFELIILLVALAAQSYVVFAPPNSLMNWYSSDDAFYYFKTAQNISEGRGATFDGIGRASGFHPLWMLVCVPVFTLARIDLMLPLRVLALISILLHAGSGALVFRALKRLLSPTASALASALWLFSPLVHHTTAQMGMESGVNAFFTLALLSHFSRSEIEQDWSRKRLLELGVLAALALFSRLDNVFLVFILGLWLLLRGSPMRYLLMGDVIFAAVSAFCSFYAVVGFYESLRPYFPAAQAMALLSIILRPLVYFLFGLYSKPMTEAGSRGWLRICAGTLTASVIAGGAMLAARSAGVFSLLPRPALLVDGLLGLLAALSLRWAYQRLRDNNQPGQVHKAEAPLDILKRQFPIWLRDGFWYALPAAAALAVYMTWNKTYFGVLMPVSGQIKHWWGSIYTAYGRPVTSFGEFFGFPDDVRASPWHLALSLPASLSRLLRPLLRSEQAFIITTFLLGITAILFLASRWPHNRRVIVRLGLVPLAAACAAQIVYYNGSNYVGLRNWYWTSQMIFTVFTAGLLLDGMIHLISSWKVPDKVIKAVAALLGLVLLVNFMRALFNLVPPRVPETHADGYLSEIRDLEGATEPGARIGMTGGGVVAYFIRDRTVINLDGLMNTADYFHQMQNGNAHEYLNQIGLNYIYGNAYIITRSEPFKEIFSTRAEQIEELEGGALFHYVPLP